MKKLSLRMRLTLITVLVLACLAVLLTLVSIYNARETIISPILSTYGQDEILVPSVSYSTVPGENDVASPGVAADTPGSAEIITDVVEGSAAFYDSSILFMLIAIAGGGVLVYFLLGRAVRPVRALSERISGISENDLSSRVTGFDTNDEISQLAHSFNVMLERLDKAFSDQKRFSSDAAHELKTPLAAIKTNIDVLQLDAEPTREEYGETIEVIKKQTGRMIRLVDDLFAMSAQRAYDFNDTIFFDAMFRDILGQLKPRIDEKGLSVTTEGCNHATKGNSVMLTRAFSNLVENAVKYNVRGGGIDISMTRDERRYTIEIADSGIGVPEDKREHIFKPFCRADDSRSRRVGGAGLGLAIARDIIGRHGGAISMRPAEKGGSIFSVTLPALREEQG